MLAAVAGIAEQARRLLDALGGGIEDGGDVGLHRIGLAGRRDAGLLHGGELLLDPFHALARFRQLVGEDQRRHDGEPHVADLAERRAQLGDALVEFMGEPGEMMFLTVVAGHAILAAADGYADMSHDKVSLRRTL